MNSKHKKPIKKPKFEIVASVGDPPATQKTPGALAKQFPKEISKVAENEHREQMKRTFGTEEESLQHRWMIKSSVAMSDFGKGSSEHVPAALRGIEPKDTVEGMLATLMVPVHSLALDCIVAAAVPGQTDRAVEVYIKLIAKLGRTFADLVEAFDRHRNRGQQKMTVEHVHVYEGGQAIVGQVNQKGTQIKGTGTN
jgi:hypothetical protein